MLGSTFTEYTALHGSYTVCDWCGTAFEPRIRAGPNRDRFCQPSHKDRWWNRRRREDPPALAADAAGDEKEVCRDHPTIAQTESKLQRVLSALAGGETLNRFQAERSLNDHVLPSTISEIQRRFGIRVSRRRKNRCAYYWLPPVERQKAVKLLRNPDRHARYQERRELPG